MARPKGSANLSASLEVLAGAPLDARTVVNDLTELVTASTFPYYYVGMMVAVKSEESVYLLTGAPTTDIANWKEVGATGKPEIEWGYLYNNKMYKESTHVTEITAETDMLYITKDTDKFYKFDGTDYVQIGGGVDAVVYQPGGSYLFENIPALSSATLGFVYDVSNSFTTTSDFLEGAGIDYPAGTNIVVVNAGTSASPVYKYDVLIGELSGYQKKIQYTALPTASADYEGQIYQYMGATTVYHTNGHFYKCEEITPATDPKTYHWVEKAVMTYTAGDGIIIENDEISTDNMQSGDMADVVTPLPSIPARYHKYSTSEQVVGEWIDGKPIYQKTIEYSKAITVDQTTTFTDIADVTSLSIDTLVSLTGTCNWGTALVTLPYHVITDQNQFNADLFIDQNKRLRVRTYRNTGTVDITNTKITLQYTKTS